MIAALYDEPLPPLAGHEFVSTQFDFVPVGMVLLALVLYLWAVKRNNTRHPRHPWSVGKTVAWLGALLTTSVSIFSFVGVYDGDLFWDHMVQHLILIMVAAPLFAIASPLDLAWRSTSGTAHIVVTETLRSRVAKLFGHPVTAFVLYAVIIPVSHLTSWYNLTLEHESVHNAEHLAFLVVGYLFWRQIFGSDPNKYRLHPALQFFYLFMAIPIDTFTGLSLAGANKELFPAYFATHRTWGPSYVTDLHVGGDIMWVVGDTLMLWPMIPVALRWMHMDERKALRVDRELDAEREAGSSHSPVSSGTVIHCSRPARRGRSGAVIALMLVAAASLLTACGGANAPAAPSTSQGLVVNRTIPDVQLISSSGAPTSLADYRGKDIVMAPFLSLCQDECPLVTGAFIALQRDVRAAGLGSKVVFMEITVDPGRDTPARLAAYSKEFGADWVLATGTPANLNALWKFLGVSVQIVPEGQPAKIDWYTDTPLTYDVDHTDGYFLIDASGRERFSDSNPPDLHGQLDKKLTNLLNDGGLQNLDHQGNPNWTLSDALSSISWLVGQNIPGVAST